MSTSTDGGLTWGPPTPPGGLPSGLGGQPVAQPNGTVVVPYSTGNEIRVFRSSDGGANWTSSTSISPVSEHGVAGGLRTSALPSAEVDGEGRVYVAWQDCRFRSGCPANDIVYSTSTDGNTWSAVTRVPIDPTTSGIDHFIPGIAVDRATSGNSAHLALGYYYYPVSACTAEHVPAHRRLRLLARRRRDLDAADPRCRPDEPGLDREHRPGARWSATTSRPRSPADGKAHPAFAIAKPPTGGVFCGARGERHLRPDRSAGRPEDSCRQGADRLSRAHASSQFEHSPFPLEESRAKG